MLFWNLQVLITKIIKPEANVAFEWTSNEIGPRSYVSLELVWSPQVEWATREVVQFTDNRNFKKDVAVVLKAVDKTSKNLLKKAISSKKQPERSITRKLVIKSPSPRTKQRARLAAATLNAAKRNAAILTSTENQIRNEMKMTKNVLGSQNNGSSYGAQVGSYGAQVGSHATAVGSPSNNIAVNGKENVQPIPTTPNNASAIFDSIRFTPLTGNRPNDRNDVEYLASLATPTAGIQGYSLSHQFEELAMEPLNLSICREHGRDYSEALDLSPRHRNPINDQTTVLNEVYTPQPNRNWMSPSQIPPEAQKTPVIVYNHQHNITGQKLSTTFELSPRAASRSPHQLSPYRSRTIEYSYNEHTTAVNRTRLLSPAPADHLYVIEEEQTYIEMSETFVKHTQHERTFNVVDAGENLARDVKLVGSPLRKKFQSMKDLSNSSNNMSLEQQILRNNQGSMPNLHKLDKVKSIENNRYFYQSIEKDLPLSESNEPCANASLYSMQSGISTHSVAFQEHEILAQSSVFNIDEIGRARPTTSSNGAIPPSVQFFIDSNDALDAVHATHASETFAKPTSTVRESMIAKESMGRPSVITPTGQSLPSASFTQKRTRDGNSNSGSTRSLNKESPPKRVRLATNTPSPRVCLGSNNSPSPRVRLGSNNSPSPRLPRGQSFRTRTWGEVQAKKFRIPRVPIQKLVLKKPEEERIIMYDPDLHLRGKRAICNLFRLFLLAESIEMSIQFFLCFSVQVTHRLFYCLG